MTRVSPMRTVLRMPVAADEGVFTALALRSRALHSPWTSAPSTPEAFAAHLAQLESPANQTFLVCLPGAAVADRGGEQIAGAIHLSQMVMGNFRSAYLGYYVFAGYERRGVMRSGLQQVVRHAFAHLNLHRLEANIQPGNTASIALVRACGFTQEGFSPRYLKINGRWRDHERWAIVAS
ncbi:MAG: GNAT family N-acetyltransferase [Gammaproteobacteria bacterium]|nr:GNAT family N-acetyltransferase [Gammaproteobacteria bacterium]MBU1506485.1 GNAT family N-acetyltransferase [Gammaproteobacteria bacterium]MBU2119080.1 GNAT family N-acetyltransferase [Gammaproteobacteria bacterium]MBU2171854.1 GNAT family N-acetyltransferase [Gammaproteobacteria bacterium]MBU2201270.1 GNAT family N-acetyltransferase [Gammaproteobacteria bacterium]